MEERTLVGGKMTPTAFSLHHCLQYSVSLQEYYTNDISDPDKSNMKRRPGISKASISAKGKQKSG